MKKPTECRLVKKYGKLYVEVRYVGYDWTGWYFLASDEPKAHWIYVPQFNVWRCNISSF